jgi:hypothetical protein
MKYNIKFIYTALYISILLSIFILFAIIINTASGKFSLYSFIFIILLLVTGWYVLATLKTPSQEEEILQAKTENPEQAEPNASGTVTEEKNTEEEKQMDIHKIIPPKSLFLEQYTEELLQNMATDFRIVQGLLYIKNPHEDLFHCYAQYAYFSENKPVEFTTGETLPGQAVKNKAIVSLNNIPDQYMTIASGLGKSNPKHLVFVPLKNQEEVVGLIEYATFEPLTERQFKALEDISKKVAETISKHLKK